VILTAYSFAKWLGFRDRYLTVAYVSISVLSFEGIFSPLQIAAYSWHQTSITHLWPIALTFLSWAVSGRTGIHHVLLVCLGFVVGNSNSAEAVWAFLATIAFIKTFLAGKQESTQMKRLSLNFFLLGNFVGILLTVAAPGFWNRANNSVGFPESLTDFVLRFAKSASAFGFDILTHPYLYLTLILGVLSRNLVNENSLLALRKIKWFLIAVSILLYSLLVLGTTLGYPAWHQSLGLFVVLTPTFFVLGLSSIPEKSRSEIQAYKVFMYSILILCLFLTARTSVLEINRSARWDLAFHSNLCSISRGETKDLIGADLVYPIFRKGVEDIETWKWMKESYIGWLTNEYLPNSSACKD
jgi:hypothetical protein